ncbi:MAG: VCBS repeat-containing protein, partial [Chloroflexota bacterium]
MFVDFSDKIRHNRVQRNYGVAVSDIDHDGQFEIFVCGFGTGVRNGARNIVLKWNGQHFVDITDDELADEKRMAIGVVTADIDGDGYEELYILNTDTFGGKKRYTDRLFAHNGDGWTDLFSLDMNRAALNMTAGRSVVAVDRFGSGFYGIFVANYGGPMRYYELDEDGQLRDIAPEIGLNLVTGGRALLSLPLVSDQMDIFAGNENGANFLFRNNGDGTFTNIAPEAGVEDR